MLMCSGKGGTVARKKIAGQKDRYFLTKEPGRLREQVAC